MNKYWKIGDNDQTLHEVDLSEEEKEYLADIPDHPGWKEEGHIELVPKLKADFGYRSDVTMPEAGFITAAISWYADKHWVPKTGLIASVMPGEVATTDQARERQGTSSKIAHSADGNKLYQQMQERAHLEARQLDWDKAAIDRASAYVINA